MAASIKTTMDSDEAEPMRAEVFDIAVSALSFHGARQETPRIVQAARAVLVEGMRSGEAATQFGILPVRVSEAVGRIRDKWAAICAERGLVTETFSLSPVLIELLRQIELEALQPLQADAAGKRRKKAAAPSNTASDTTSAKLPAHKEPSTQKLAGQNQKAGENAVSSGKAEKKPGKNKAAPPKAASATKPKK
jgi:hypothetical protein